MKQVIVVRADLKLPKGKMAAQASHASVEAVLRSSSDKVDEWRSQGMKKVVLKVADEKQLLEVQQLAKSKKLVAAVITDAGKTVVAPGTRTCIGIGPDDENIVDSITGKLQMM